MVSPEAGDGKSAIVAGLALVKRDAGERVAIVEANFRRPIQARMLGIEAATGLVDVLAGTLSLDEAMQRVLPLDRPLDAEPSGDAPVATAVQARARARSRCSPAAGRCRTRLRSSRSQRCATCWPAWLPTTTPS